MPPKLDVIDTVAKAIYEAELDDPEAPIKAWANDQPWDQEDDTLCEWERDDYRRMAEAAIRALAAFKGFVA